MTHEKWVEKYEHDQAIALDDPTYHLPPFMPIKEALKQVAQELKLRRKHTTAETIDDELLAA